MPKNLNLGDSMAIFEFIKLKKSPSLIALFAIKEDSFYACFFVFRKPNIIGRNQLKA